jgi:hypothetical protein
MEGQDTMTSDPVTSEGDSEVFRFGGFGTILLISLLAFVGSYPLLLGNVAGRLAGGLILAVILVSSAVTAGRSHTHRVVGVILAILLLGLQIGWLESHNKIVEAIAAGVLAIYLSLYVAVDLPPRPVLRADLCPQSPCGVERLHSLSAGLGLHLRLD